MSLSKYNKTTKELEPIAGGFDVQGILDDIGDLTELDTSTKTDLVSAVNEVKGDIPTKTSDLTNDSGFVGLGETASTAYAGDKGKANTSAIEATQDMISDAYDATATYAVGDYCIYENGLYRCNTAIATGEAFTPSKWDAVTVSEIVKQVEFTEHSSGSFTPVRNGFVTIYTASEDIYIQIKVTLFHEAGGGMGAYTLADSFGGVSIDLDHVETPETTASSNRNYAINLLYTGYIKAGHVVRVATGYSSNSSFVGDGQFQICY